MKKKHHKGAARNQGKSTHPDMTSYIESDGGKDEHAHPSHHEFNEKFGMEDGFAPPRHGEEGGEGMSENECDYEGGEGKGEYE